MLNIAAASFLLILSTTEIALGWGDVGHQIVGDIAERTIKPQTKEFLRGLVGIEPLFISATWPDMVRSDLNRFAKKISDPHERLHDHHNFDDFHFCEIPTGYTYRTRPVKNIKDCFGAIRGSSEILASGMKREEKLIALRYLAHVVGDIHQPLHVGNGYDRGGNACQVVWKPMSSARPANIRLHTLWDEALVQFMGSTFVDSSKNERAPIYLSDYMTHFMARNAQLISAEGKRKWGHGKLTEWLEESQALRENGVYPDATPGPRGEEYKHRPYCQWYTDQIKGTIAPGSQVDAAKVPTLTGEEYGRRFAPVIELQLIKAGLRLAAMLDQIAEKNDDRIFSDREVSNKREEKILKNVQDKFRN